MLAVSVRMIYRSDLQISVPIPEEVQAVVPLVLPVPPYIR